jgi:AraC-like DNA-binding protein
VEIVFLSQWRAGAWDGQFSVKLMAQQARISVREVHRRVRRRFGCAPRAWLARERCRLAVVWLRAGRLSMKEIAHRLFFSSSSAFIRAFRRIKGWSPWRFRKCVLSDSGYSAALPARFGLGNVFRVRSVAENDRRFKPVPGASRVRSHSPPRQL